MNATEQQLQMDIDVKPYPKVTQDMVEAEVKSYSFHVFEGTTMTVCCITLKNGFTVLGEAACVDPHNFDRSIGERLALKDAKAKIWPLLGFRLRDQITAAHEKYGPPV